MTLYETVKGRTESHNPMSNHKGKNRNPKSPYTHEIKKGRTDKHKKVKTLCKAVKGRTGKQDPM